MVYDKTLTAQSTFETTDQQHNLFIKKESRLICCKRNMTINGPKSSVWHIATIGVIATMMAKDYSEKSIRMEKIKKPIDHSIPIKWMASHLFSTFPINVV
jgi:hypothetical protein